MLISTPRFVITGVGRWKLRVGIRLSSTDASRYVRDVRLYSPVSAGVNGEDCAAPEFFADSTCLTRFAAPRTALSRLISPECELSPLVRIRGELKFGGDSWGYKNPADKRIIDEMRSPANIHKTETEAPGHILSDAVRSGRAAPAVVVAYILKDRI